MIYSKDYYDKIFFSNLDGLNKLNKIFHYLVLNDTELMIFEFKKGSWNYLIRNYNSL